jgi:hypothetical protein
MLLAAVSLASLSMATSSEAAVGASDPWAVCTAGLNVTGSPVPPLPEGSVLYAVSSPTATDAWAAGALVLPSGLSLPLVEHWNGSTWSEESFDLPSLLGLPLELSRFNAVAAFSSTDAWAAGEMQDSATSAYLPVLMHWNGTDWEFRHLPVVPGNNQQVEALSGTGGGDLWALEDNNVTLLEHSNGTAWSSVPVPFGGIYSMDSFAPDSVEIAGENGLTAEMADYQNGQWTTVTDPGYVIITDVSGTGPTDVWAVAGVSNTSGQDYELQHYNGSTWTNIAPEGYPGGVVTSDGVDKAEGVLGQFGDATQVNDPDGSSTPSLSSTPLTWDPSWGDFVSIRAISATSRGALFAVGSIEKSGTTTSIDRGIVYRDC